MFTELQEKLSNTFAKLRGRGVLTEGDIKEGLREVRRVLLEADVNFQLSREFLERVEQKAVGTLQVKNIQPAQQLVKIVYDELVVLLGERREGLRMSSLPPTVVMLVGLQGSGKTTTAAKLALKLKGEGRQTRLIALDVYRPAAIDQLETLGRDLDVPVFSDRSTNNVEKIARAGLEVSRHERDRVVLLDTAGRLQIDEDMMGELRRLKEAVRPDEILQQGDVISLVEKAQATMDAEAAKKLEKKVRKEGLDLQDFLGAMKQIERLGPIEGILKMLPGVNAKMLKQVNSDPKRLKHAEAIVLSMTLEERKDPSLLNGSRRARVAKGSGRPISDVNRLLEQFREMQKMMKKAASGGGRLPPGMMGRYR
jgi:signal recognition particle GTPase